MKPLRAESNETSTARAGGAVACWVVALAVVIAPLMLGCTGAWPRFGLEAATASAVVIWISARRPSRLSLVLPMAIAATALLQIIPLPDRVLVALAPISAGAWKVAHEGMPATFGTISIDPGATAAGTRRMLIGLATIGMVADLASIARLRAVLSAAMAVSGMLVLTVAVVFPVSSRDRMLLGFVDLKGPIVFWKSPVISPLQSTGVGEPQWVTVGDVRYQADEGIVGDGLGSYISSNQCANAVCLTVPLMAAAWLAWSRQRASPGVQWLLAIAILGTGIWATAILARSRAGGVAMIFAAAAFMALALPKGWPKRCAAVAVGAGGLFLFAAVLVFYGPLRGMEAVAPAGARGALAAALADPRVVASQVATRIFAASPWLGTGLGTYGDLYQRFTGHPYVLYFAHNDYAQLLAETGLVGASLAALFAWAAGQRLRRFLAATWGTTSPAAILAAGAWAAVAGMAAHGLFDWNMHVPANGFLACVAIGLAFSAAPKVAGRVSMPSICKASGPVARLAFTATCLGCLIFLARDAFSEQAQTTLRRAITNDRIRAAKPAEKPATPTLLNAIGQGERAARWAPANAYLALLLGQAHLHMAAEPQPIDEANAHVEAADRWIRRAKRHCASLRGLPEPVSGQSSTTAGHEELADAPDRGHRHTQ